VLVLFKVRTLFVSGLPMDARPRELHLLFRAYKVSCATCYRTINDASRFKTPEPTFSVNFSTIHVV